jgi:hypothetical protein
MNPQEKGVNGCKQLLPSNPSSCTVKVVGKIIATQLVSFINKHNTFRNSLIGFRKLKSIKDATALIINDVIEYLD